MEDTETLLKYCYKRQKEYVSDVGQREFDCLISLVEHGTIKTFAELKEYGIEYD
jgi:hypothetical protein